MENNNSAFIKAFPITWVVTFVVTLLLWIIVSKTWGVSYLLGSVTSMMMMSLLYRQGKKLLASGEKDVQKKAIFNYVLRYIFYALILVIAGLSDNLEILAVAIGLFSFRVALSISLFLEKRGENNG